ncbi:hypothetical protein CSOJ01_10320 [Colletotrichum sojae]|uniref:Uncharacterized protein n=1 Tax=Colletotrichum sojae TaxID=2175907 RepID=A0A8H6J152_9PEZI|nr:hypothetical protein CSOJ01_10320 [Colletotrichum sojae]
MVDTVSVQRDAGRPPDAGIGEIEAPSSEQIRSTARESLTSENASVISRQGMRASAQSVKLLRRMCGMLCSAGRGETLTGRAAMRRIIQCAGRDREVGGRDPHGGPAVAGAVAQRPPPAPLSELWLLPLCRSGVGGRLVTELSNPSLRMERLVRWLTGFGVADALVGGVVSSRPPLRCGEAGMNMGCSPGSEQTPLPSVAEDPAVEVEAARQKQRAGGGGRYKLAESTVVGGVLPNAGQAFHIARAGVVWSVGWCRSRRLGRVEWRSVLYGGRDGQDSNVRYKRDGVLHSQGPGSQGHEKSRPGWHA